MATVYIVQQPRRRNRETGEFEPLFDMTPARAYGEIEVLLPSTTHHLVGQVLCKELRNRLRNFGEDDFLLGAGDPMAIGAATMIAAEMNRGRVKFLRWDRRTAQYITFQLVRG